ncbi:MAG: hypothetical protein ACTSRC_01750 [Candidatus Helarchaeota archaeon]
MGKFFGSLAYFLTAVLLSYLINMYSNIEPIAQHYLLSDPSFKAPQLLATFELLHYPFLYLTVIPAWLIAGFLAGVITRTWKGALLVSIITSFILSLTWIFLMSRYTPNYWSTFLLGHSALTFFEATFGIALLFGAISGGFALLGAYINSATKSETTPAPLKEIQSTCPTCGTVFQSAPKYCYKCNTLLKENEKKE